MQDRQVKTEEQFKNALSHLDIQEMGWNHYITLVAKSMISRLCYEASRNGSPTDEDYYENLNFDCCRFLDFMNDISPQKKGTPSPAEAYEGV